ncbi:MAG TPA: flagellin, partial [bacterium]|nr:flagellin [bacterium]
MLVTTNLGAYQALRYFNNTSNVVSKTIRRLSSGVRINSASDDCAGLSVSEKFKADLLGMKQALRNVQEGISILQTADDSYIQVQNTLNKMKVLAIQSANDTLSSDERLALDNELFQYKVELDRIFRRTTSGNNQHIFGEPETGWVDKTSSEIPSTYSSTQTFTDGYSQTYSVGSMLTTAQLRAANASNILGTHQVIDTGTSQTVFTESSGQTETFQTGKTDSFSVSATTQTKSVGVTEVTYTPGTTDTFNRGLVNSFTAGVTQSWTRGTHETKYIDGAMNINLTASPDTASVIVKKITLAGSETLSEGSDYSIGGAGNQTINFFGLGINTGDEIYVEYVQANGSKFDLGEYAETDSVVVKVSSLNGGAALTEGVHYQIVDTGSGNRIELLDPAPAGPGNGNYTLVGDNNENHHNITVQYIKEDENQFVISGAAGGDRILDYGDGVTGEIVKTVSSIETVGAGTIAAGTTLVKGTHYDLIDDGFGNYTGIELIGNYRLKGNKNGAAGTSQQSLKIEYVRTGDNVIALTDTLLDYAGTSTGSEKVVFNGAALTRDTHYTVAGNVITLLSASNFKGSNNAANNHSFNIKYLTDASQNTIALTNEPASESVMQVRVNGVLYADNRFTLDQGATVGTVEGDETLTFDDPYKLRGGDSVTITYMTEDPCVWNITEADAILSGTEKVRIDGVLKTAGVDYALTSAAGANQITFTAGLIKKTSSLSVQYLTTAENSFTLSQNPLDYYTGAGVDEDKQCGSEIVKVNGVIKTAVTDYTIDGNAINFLYNLSAGDAISVEYAYKNQFNCLLGTPLDYFGADNEICGSEIVKIGGVELTAGGANDYTIDGTTLDLSNYTIVGNKSVSVEYADNDTFTLRDEGGNPTTPFLDSLEIYVGSDPVKKSEGTAAGDWWNFNPNPPGVETSQIQFNPADGVTNGLRGKNNIEARFIKVATPLTVNLNNDALNYSINSADGPLYGSALVYLDKNHNGTADAGDELLQENAIEDNGIDCYWFTAANQIKLSENLQSKLVGNVDIIVDYAYDNGTAQSDILTLPAVPMNYTPAAGSEKIYVKDQDTNGDGFVTAADADEGWRLLTRSEDGGATGDYILNGNQVQFVNDGRFAGNPDVYVQYITDNQNLFTTSKKFLDYTDGLNGSEIVTVDGVQLSQAAGNYAISESSAGAGYDQVTLQGLNRLIGMRDTAGTLKPTDDVQHTIKIAYDTKATFSLVELPFTVNNYIGWI